MRSNNGCKLSSWLTTSTVVPAPGTAPTSASGTRSPRRGRAPRSAHRPAATPGVIRARAAATRCCWPTLSVPARRCISAGSSCRACSRRAISASSGPLMRVLRRREAQAQRDVVAHAEKRQQVELLEDHAKVIGAEAVPRSTTHRLQPVAGDLDAALAGQQHARQQAQQRALATATDPAQQHAAALLDPQPRHIQHQARAVAELHALQRDHRSHAHGPSTTRRLSAVNTLRFWPCAVALLTITSCRPGIARASARRWRATLPAWRTDTAALR